jgi:hypothetical protein
MKINKRARIKIKTKEKYRKIRSETGVGSPAASGSFYLIQGKKEKRDVHFCPVGGNRKVEGTRGRSLN